eukprot:TRINITY_DN5543_c0_g1_i1.p1 TRINITY_DN5543_c0_g1~~TRINITY_DN5543_c0_g1_i1.p1  ORF type:complete len:297 (+),score=113.85 TRINITY_DN5543_c0_g1_i1:158-1048(+)
MGKDSSNVTPGKVSRELKNLESLKRPKDEEEDEDEEILTQTGRRLRPRITTKPVPEIEKKEEKEKVKDSEPKSAKKEKEKEPEQKSAKKDKEKTASPKNASPKKFTSSTPKPTKEKDENNNNNNNNTPPSTITKKTPIKKLDDDLSNSPEYKEVMLNLKSQFDDIDNVDLETEDEAPTPSRINFRPTIDTDQIFEDLETPSNSQSTPSSTPSNSQKLYSSQRPIPTPPYTPVVKKVAFSSMPVTPVQTPVSIAKTRKSPRSSTKASGKKTSAKMSAPSPTFKVSPQTLRLVVKGSL